MLKDEIKRYAEKCISGENPSCKKHKWACERFLKDISNDNFEYEWNETCAAEIVKWFKLLRHSKGELARKPIELNDWQRFCLCQIYGWRHKETGRRRFNKAYMQVGRKNAKSQMLAGVALFESSVWATRNGEVYEYYTAGSKRDQSKIVFNECDLMTKGSPLRLKFDFVQGEIRHRKTGSIIKPLSRDDGREGGDGTNPAGMILDEYHQHKTTDFYDLALGSARKEPLLFIITTAGKDLTYPCYTQEYEYTSKILDPDIDVENDSYFVDILEMDEGDDPGDVNTWKKSNPIRAYYPAGIKKIKDDYKVAKEIPEKMISFMTKILNVWVQATDSGYMDMGKWKKCEVKDAPIDVSGHPVYIGLDMSAKIDLTSVTFLYPFQQDETDERGRKIPGYYIETHSFIPNMDKLREHLTKDKVPYDSWVQRGFLTITNTPIVDQSQVEQYIYNKIKDNNLQVECFAFDPANASKMMMDISDDGYDVEEVYQSHKSLNESTQGFREAVYCGNVFYKPNPLLNYAMSNAKIRTSNGLIKIDKDATTKRIDPVDATLCAFKLALYHEFNETYDNYLDEFLDSM